MDIHLLLFSTSGTGGSPVSLDDVSLCFIVRKVFLTAGNSAC